MSLKVSADFDEISNNKGDVNLDVDIGHNEITGNVDEVSE
jgi:hypothetical protein